MVCWARGTDQVSWTSLLCLIGIESTFWKRSNIIVWLHIAAWVLFIHGGLVPNLHPVDKEFLRCWSSLPVLAQMLTWSFWRSPLNCNPFYWSLWSSKWPIEASTWYLWSNLKLTLKIGSYFWRFPQDILRPLEANSVVSLMQPWRGSWKFLVRNFREPPETPKTSVSADG